MGDRQRETLVFGRGLDRYSGVMVAEPASFNDLRNVHVQAGRIESTYGHLLKTTIDCDAILAIQPIRSQGIVGVVVLDGADVQLYQTAVDLTNPVLIGDVWTALDDEAGFPRVIVADSYDKLVICHDEPEFDLRQKTRYWDVPDTGTPIKDLEADLYQPTDPETPVATYFRGVVRHLSYLFFWGYGSEDSADDNRPEIVRNSSPLDPLALKAPHWFIAGQRGDPVLACMPASNGSSDDDAVLLVFKENETYRIEGYDRQTFAIKPVEGKFGSVGMRLTINVGGYCYFWSLQGPRRSGGGPSIDLALPLDLAGPVPDPLALTGSASNGFVVHSADRREIVWWFGQWGYALSIADPDRPQWSFRKRAFEANCGSEVFQSTAGIAPGPGISPEAFPEITAAVLTGVTDREVLVSWDNTGTLDALTDKAEIWARPHSTNVWEKVAEGIALAGADDTATATLPFFADTHEIAMRFARNGVYAAAYSSPNPSFWPAVSRINGIVTEWTGAPTLSSPLWLRTSATLEQVNFFIASAAAQANLPVEVEWSDDGGANWNANLAGPFTMTPATGVPFGYFIPAAGQEETHLQLRARQSNVLQTGAWSEILGIYVGPVETPQALGLFPFGLEAMYQVSWVATAFDSDIEIWTGKDGGTMTLNTVKGWNQAPALINITCPASTVQAKVRRRTNFFGVFDYSEFTDTASIVGDCAGTGPPPPPPPPSGLRPPLPHALPSGVTLDRTTGLFSGSPASVRYAPNPITSWLDIDASLGADPVANMAALQAQINTDAAAGVRRGYEFGATREFEGSLVLPHNVGLGWSGLRPIGYTIDLLKTTVGARARGGVPIFRAVTASTPAICTSSSGASDGHHGRWAFFGIDVTVDATLGATSGAKFNAGIIRLGQSDATQNTLAKVPDGFLLHDVHIYGDSITQWVRRGLELHAKNVQLRACRIWDIHANAAGTSITDSHPVVGWNGPGQYHFAYSIFEGGDECAFFGGAATSIPDLTLGDIYFESCRLTADAAYIADWGRKSVYGQQNGRRVLHAYGQLEGIEGPTVTPASTGYAISLRTGAFGSNPNQQSRDVQFYGCRVTDAPALMRLVAFEGPGSGSNLMNVALIDCFGTDLNIAPHTDSTKRTVLAIDAAAPIFGIHLKHCSIASSTAVTTAAIFGLAGSAPGIEVEDCIFPPCGSPLRASGTNGISSAAGSGTTALDSIAGVGTWIWRRITFAAYSGAAIVDYPATTETKTTLGAGGVGFVDHAAGDHRITAGTTYYRSAPDGWNRGVSDPDAVYAQLLKVPVWSVSGEFVSWTAGTGSRLVNWPVPLPKGVLMPTALDTVRVLKAGVEQAIYIEDHGVFRHDDGSLRAVLIQTDQTLTFGVPVALVVEIGLLRNTGADLTKTTLTFGSPAGNDFKTAHPEAMMNFSKEYLSSCQLFTRYPLRYQGIADGLEQSYDDNLFTDWQKFAVDGGVQASEGGLNLDPWNQWKNWDGQPSGSEPFLQYDAGYQHILMWLMTGEAEYARMGICYAAWYYAIYAAVPNNVAAWMLSPKQMAAQYVLTGDEDCRTALVALTTHHFAVAQAPGGGIDDHDAELRPFAFRLQCGQACFMVGDTSVNWKTRTDTYLTAWHSDPTCWITSGVNIGAYWQRIMFSGACQPLAANAQVVHNFFIPITVNSLYDVEQVFNVSLPSTITGRIQGMLEYLRLTQYRPTGNSSVTNTPDFKYQNNSLAIACSQPGPSSDVYDLNGLYAAAFRTAGARHGNAAWKAMGENMLQTMQRRTHRGPGAAGNGPFYFNVRVLQECYRWFYAAISLRN